MTNKKLQNGNCRRMRRIFGRNLAALAIISCGFSALADNYVVVNKAGKIFDAPDATGYVTLNSNNEEVLLCPGMVFKVLESAHGWHIVEYSPGLRGYLSEQVTATECTLPKPGNYSIHNIKGIQLKATKTDGVWGAQVGDKSFKGKEFGKVVVFFSANGHPAYSLVDFGKGCVVVCYDNDVTKFF